MVNLQKSMMGMKIFSLAISAYRNFSTKSTCGTTKLLPFFSQNNSEEKTTNPKRKVLWTDEQLDIISHVEGGFSIFITGSAGTGKTSLVNHIIKLLKKVHGRNRVFVTASTGIAACAIKGQTLHSFAGIGTGVADEVILLDRVLSDKQAIQRWNKAAALVIDEISMIDAELFEKIEYIARKTREIDDVWGGLQLIVSGDFFQLPPVSKISDPSRKVFAFEADCWNDSFNIQVELTKVFRQSDARLVKFLQGIRRGQTDPEDLQFLNQSCLVAEQNIPVVQLYPRNDDVNRVNEEKIESLAKWEKKVIYIALDSGNGPWKSQLQKGIAPTKLELCVGARVMLIKNLNIGHQLVNGATGTVIEFVDSSTLQWNSSLPLVRFDSGREVVIEPEMWYVTEGNIVMAQRHQIPLILAWALSIHKCQGMTLDRLSTDLSRAFGCGMVYVALSRVRSLEGLHLSGFSASKIKADPKVLKFYKFLESGKENKDVDDDVNKQGENTSNLLAVLVQTSKGGMKEHFPLSEFLHSRLKGK